MAEQRSQAHLPPPTVSDPTTINPLTQTCLVTVSVPVEINSFDVYHRQISHAAFREVRRRFLSEDDGADKGADKKKMRELERRQFAERVVLDALKTQPIANGQKIVTEAFAIYDTLYAEEAPNG